MLGHHTATTGAIELGFDALAVGDVVSVTFYPFLEADVDAAVGTGTNLISLLSPDTAVIEVIGDGAGLTSNAESVDLIYSNGGVTDRITFKKISSTVVHLVGGAGTGVSIQATVDAP